MKIGFIRIRLCLLTLLALSLLSCFTWDNPVDPQNITAALISPKNVKAESVDAFLYRLSWTDESQVEEGFKIDRKDGNGSWQINYATVGANVTQYDIDLSDTLPEEISITWRIRTYHQSYYSGYSNEALLEPNTVANPVATPAGSTYNNQQEVVLATVTSGATIRYTLDNSDPNENSTIYSAPILVNAITTCKAQAYKNGWKSSSITANTYNMVVVNPVLSIPSGSYSSVQSVSISCATNGASIRYTTDGSEPTVSSPIYNNPILISVDTTIKAKAFKAGWLESSTTLASYSFTVATPTFNPAGGVYLSTQNVTISCSTNGAVICYTTDGSDPTSSSALFSIPILVSVNTTIKAKAFKAGWLESSTTSANYNLTVATPTFDPTGGLYLSTQNVTISCSTDGAEIRYTTDGSEPIASSLLYSNPVLVFLDTTLKAKAFKELWTSSEMVTAVYSNSAPIGFVFVPSGTITMGDTRGSGQSNELPTHSVSLNSFFMSKYEVTQGEYQNVMGSNPASGYGVGASYPVYNVNWYAAITYCNLRSISEDLTPVYTISGSTNPASWGTVPLSYNATWDTAICNWSANGYRLPTEAEWEYAARGGTNTPDYLYSGSDDINAVAWYDGNNTPSGSKQVGTKSQNFLGIYDMSGNEWEWCWDWYVSYSSSPANNPTGPSGGSYRVFRGGGWSVSQTLDSVSADQDCSLTAMGRQ
ncbi:MAG: hypothetical protein CVU48_08940 [Candidatus Cloacimonetes bacterium HGW-Cloacimonetes-1]|nr:MAG: hypothetical protein CVU48_08940 [Candidatus Cloacimonetes bacterium HGW-Cloacimonetes-1]